MPAQRAGVVLLALCVALGAQTVPDIKRTAGPTAAGLNLAYFFKPPLDGTTPEFIAQHFHWIGLTQNDESYRDRLRAAEYEGPVLQCTSADVVEGPGPYVDHTQQCDNSYEPYQKSVADRKGIFCSSIHPHESWFLHNAHGQRLYSKDHSPNAGERTWYYMNPGNPAWRHFFAKRLRYWNRLGYDGFFLDNVHLSRAALFHDPDNKGGLLEYSNDPNYRAAVLGMLSEVRAQVGRRQVWANLVNDPGGLDSWRPYFAYLDGVLIEDFAVGWRGLDMSERERREQLEKVRDALARGENVIAVAQGGPEDTNRLNTALACYWLLANGHLYFRFADWNEKAYRTVHWYSQFEMSPGRPVGKLVMQADYWKRDYEDAEVRLDFTSGRAELRPITAQTQR
jgi:hypothetical protein